MSIKINAMCGYHVLDGWTNVDAVVAPKAPRPPEILADALSIPLPSGCANEVMCIHGFEHVYAWQAPELLAEFHRLLEPGGLLVLEMPDIKKCAANLIRLVDGEGIKSLDSLAMWGIYGDPGTKDPWMSHKWGYTPKTLKGLLKRAGFGSFVDAPTKWHPIGRQLRDLRVEARKK